MWTDEEVDYLRQLTEGAPRNRWKQWTKQMNKQFETQRNWEQLRAYWRTNINNVPSERKPKYREEVEILGNGNIKSDKLVELSLEQAKDPQYILEAHGFDHREFELVNAKSSQWNHSNKEQGTMVQYSSKITVKPKKEEELTPTDIMEYFSEVIEPYEVKQVNVGRRNLVIPLADLHFGVTTFEMAEDKLDEMVRVIEQGYMTIVIEQLGDLFHSSQMKASTTLKGTLLNDVDMPKAIADARRFYHTIIDSALQNAERVVVEHAAGNHSGNMEYMFVLGLKDKYPQAEVNIHNGFRTAYLLDNVGILISHGDTARNKLPMLFANEYKEIWSQAKTAEIHTGHFHTQKKVIEQDIDGVYERQMGTIKPSDAYEIENGWTTGKKVIQLLEYDKDRLKKTYEI